MKKKVTLEEYKKFRGLFNKKHPEISSALGSIIHVQGQIGAFKPDAMDEEIYHVFTRFLNRWYMDNGYTEPVKDLVYIETAGHKVIAVDTSQIISMEPVNRRTTNVVADDYRTGERITIAVKENIDDLKKRIYIF